MVLRKFLQLGSVFVSWEQNARKSTDMILILIALNIRELSSGNFFNTMHWF